MLACTPLLLAAAHARADEPASSAPERPRVAEPSPPLATVPAPDEDEPFTVYGAVVGARFVGAGGSACPDRPGATCILGAGGGVAAHISRRWPTGLAVLGGLELYSHNTGDLFEPGVLVAAFADVRAEIATAGRVRPFGRAGLVLGMLGDGIEPQTGGAGLEIALGTEVELTQLLSISAGATTRAMWFLPFETPDGLQRSEAAVPTLMFGLEVGLMLFPD